MSRIGLTCMLGFVSLLTTLPCGAFESSSDTHSTDFTGSMDLVTLARQDKELVPLSLEGDTGNYRSKEEVWFTTFSTVLEVPMVILAPAGNVLTMMAVWRTPSLRTVANMHIVSLAVSDCLVGLLLVWKIALTLDEELTYDNMEKLCYPLNYGFFTLMTVSMLTITVISVDRFLHVRFPLHYPHYISPRIALCVIVLTWSIALVMGALPVAISSHDFKENNSLRCHIYFMEYEHSSYQRLVQGGIFAMSSCVSCACYMYICCKAIRHRQAIAKITPVCRLGHFCEGWIPDKDGGLQRNPHCTRNCLAVTKRPNTIKPPCLNSLAIPSTSQVDALEIGHLTVSHSKDRFQLGHQSPKTTVAKIKHSPGKQEPAEKTLKIATVESHVFLESNFIPISLRSPSQSHGTITDLQDKPDITVASELHEPCSEAANSSTLTSGNDGVHLRLSFTVTDSNQTGIHQFDDKPKLAESDETSQPVKQNDDQIFLSNASTTEVGGGNQYNEGGVNTRLTLQHREPVSQDLEQFDQHAERVSPKNVYQDSAQLSPLPQPSSRDDTLPSLLQPVTSSEIRVVREYNPQRAKSPLQHHYGQPGREFISVTLYLTIFGMFFALWSPTFLVLVSGVRAEGNLSWLKVFFPVGLLNSFLNVLVYAWKCPDMRYSLKKLACDFFCSIPSCLPHACSRRHP